MIKRTGEIVLAIIGLVLSLLAQAFIAIIGLLMISGSKGKEGLTTFYNNYYKTMTEWEIPKKEVPYRSCIGFCANIILDSINGRLNYARSRYLWDLLHLQK